MIPWKNPYVERIIGSIRRDCLDRIIVFNEGHLKRILTRYFEYYHRWRTHLGLEMDTPQGRETQVPDDGRVTEARASTPRNACYFECIFGVMERTPIGERR
ncbi:MAG: integrase core domain-containing protein [Gammaproteobacteria bacterium]